jgi:hypothetical protein
MEFCNNNSKKRKGHTISENRKKRHKVELNFDEIKKKLVNKQGRTRSPNENALIIQSIAYFQKRGMSVDASAKECVEMFGGCHKEYHELWDYYIDSNNLDISLVNEKRGPEPRAIQEIYEMDEDTKLEILQFAFDYTCSNNTGFSACDLITFLKESKNIIITESTARYFLREFDFVWSEQSVYYGIEYQKDRINELKRFLYQYSHSLQLEQGGDYIIVASDESWSNCGTSFDHSWVHQCDSNNPQSCYVCNHFVQLANGDCKASFAKQNYGKRCVFCHAITKHGLLCCDESKNDNTTNYMKPNFEEIEDLNIKLYTCEFIIECSNSNDYHQQMDHAKYISWFKNRLIPTFEAIYPKKHAIFFVDQCPFHMVSQGFPSSSDNKPEIIQYYAKYNIDSITIRRLYDDASQNTITFYKSSFSKRPKLSEPEKGGPSKDELFMYLYCYLKKHLPGALEPEISKIARQHGHLVLFSCPYNPQDMPFEYVNSYVKLNVKQCYFKGRTIGDLKQHIRNGFYGGTTRSLRHHACIDRNLCESYFKLCQENMTNEIIKFLKINKNIHNLWNVNSDVTIFDNWLRVSKTNKTLEQYSQKFQIIINNETQNFVNF